MSSLPKGWVVATVSELAGSEGLVTDGDWIESKDQDPHGEVRLIQLADIGDGDFRDRSSRFLTTETAKRLHCTILLEGDLLIARMPDPLGRACIFPGSDRPAITAVDVFIWRGQEGGPDAKWLMHTINSPVIRDSIANQAGGTTRQRIAGGRLKQLLVPVPPLHEQQRIVAKIDSLSGKSKRARNHLDHIPRLIEKYKQTVLAAAFSGGLTPRMDPSSFRSFALAKVTRSTFYGPRISKDAYVEDGVPTLRTTDIADWGRLVPRAPPQVAITDEEFAKWRFEDGDLMVTRTGATIGKCAVYEAAMGPALPSAYLIRVRLKQDEVDPRFAALFLLSHAGRRQLLDGRTAVAQPNINADAITSVELPLPPIKCQSAIVRKLDVIFSKIDRLASEASSARSLIDHVDRAVLAKAFQGQLVLQNPEDEPASVALDRMRAKLGTASKARNRRKVAMT